MPLFIPPDEVEWQPDSEVLNLAAIHMCLMSIGPLPLVKQAVPSFLCFTLFESSGMPNFWSPNILESDLCL